MKQGLILPMTSGWAGFSHLYWVVLKCYGILAKKPNPKQTELSPVIWGTTFKNPSSEKSLLIFISNQDFLFQTKIHIVVSYKILCIWLWRIKVQAWIQSKNQQLLLTIFSYLSFPGNLSHKHLSDSVFAGYINTILICLCL